MYSASSKLALIVAFVFVALIAYGIVQQRVVAPAQHAVHQVDQQLACASSGSAYSLAANH